jgi:hypothetical protein
MRFGFYVAILGAALMAAAPATASEFIVGRDGGIYCTSVDDMKRIIVAAAAGTKGVLPGSCKAMPAGQKIMIVTRDDISDGFIMGLGLIDGVKDPVFFTASTASGPAASTAKARTSEGRDFKRVSPADVRNTPTKWEGRDVQFTGVNVYWVDDDDVRIVTKDTVTLFASHVRGTPADIGFLRENCETEREALSNKCRVNVRFSFASHGTDKPTGMFTRTILRSSDVELIRPSRR